MYTEYLGPIYEKKVAQSEALLERGARLLQQGELVAFPTETVYGLGASMLHEKALRRIFSVKKREVTQSLPVLIANLDQVSFIARDIPQEFYALARVFLPGPLTIILKKH